MLQDLLESLLAPEVITINCGVSDGRACYQLVDSTSKMRLIQIIAFNEGDKWTWSVENLFTCEAVGSGDTAKETIALVREALEDILGEV
jgi:hypothetical protein